ncbi:MAG: tetratricopeptide repeat protein, partial [Myxococcota bacterium]|nr:tetratricopeptide repeat protein [Myxococcota bacterium]
EEPGAGARRAVAVLPFDNMSGDPAQDDFVDGLVEELIMRLSRWRWFPVIARQSSFAWRGRDADLVQVGRELGAAYVVEGSVRRGGARVRVTAQLIDTASRHHVWAESYDRPLADVFRIQDEISRAIASAIHPELVQTESQRARSADPRDLGAWELAMRGLAHLDRRERAEHAKAVDCFDRALARDPQNLVAAYGRTMAFYQELFFQWSDDPAASLAGLRESAALCDRLAPDDPYTLIARGTAFMVSGEVDRAIRALRAAVERNPSAARAYSFLGQLVAMQGDPDEGIALLEEALRLSPRDPLRFAMVASIGISHLGAGRLEQAWRGLHEAIELREEEPLPWAMLASACALMGRDEEARLALEQLRRLQPDFTLEGYRRVARSVHPDYQARFEEGLRRAGFREPGED